jgi:type VI secretion system Hcp family effector
MKHQAKMRLASLLGILALAFICTAPAYAATQIQLSSRSLPGPITLTSFSQNASSPVNKGNGAQAAAAVCGQVTITKLIDQASPLFLQAVLGGSTINQLKIDFSQATSPTTPPFTYYTILLDFAKATSITQSDNSNNIISEQIVLTASRFHYHFFGQNPDGTIGSEVLFGFDCATQTQLPG